MHNTGRLGNRNGSLVELEANRLYDVDDSEKKKGGGGGGGGEVKFDVLSSLNISPLPHTVNP